MENEINNVYGRINKIDTRVTELEVTQPYLKDLIERSIRSSEKLGETLQGVQIAMAKMNEKMDAQADALEAMKKDFEESNKKVDERIGQVNSKLSGIEEKGKFDIWLWLKTNFPWIIIAVGVGAYFASKFIKF